VVTIVPSTLLQLPCLSAYLDSKEMAEELVPGKNAQLALPVSSVLEALLLRWIAHRVSNARHILFIPKKIDVLKAIILQQELHLAPSAQPEVIVPKLAHLSSPAPPTTIALRDPPFQLPVHQARPPLLDLMRLQIAASALLGTCAQAEAAPSPVLLVTTTMDPPPPLLKLASTLLLESTPLPPPRQPAPTAPTESGPLRVTTLPPAQTALRATTAQLE